MTMGSLSRVKQRFLARIGVASTNELFGAPADEVRHAANHSIHRIVDGGGVYDFYVLLINM